MQNNIHYATVEELNHDFFVKNGSDEFLSPEIISKKKEKFV